MQGKRDASPDFLLLAEAAGQTVSSLAEALEKDEIWVARVLAGQQTCTVGEAAIIAGRINVDPACACHLVSRPQPRSSKWREFFDTFFDRVILGAIALGVALLVQYQFNAFTLSRERAVAVSNFKSEFLLDRYAQTRTDIAALLVNLEQARSSIATDKNSPPSLAWPARLNGLVTEIEVDIGIIASAHPATRASSNALVESMHAATRDLVDRNVPERFPTLVEDLKARFFEFGEACQLALIDTVGDELDAVRARTTLWESS